MSVEVQMEEREIRAKTFVYLTTDSLPFSLYFSLCSGEARQKRGEVSLWDTFQDNVKRQPDGVAYVYEGKSWTFKQADLGELQATKTVMVVKGKRGLGRGDEDYSCDRQDETSKEASIALTGICFLMRYIYQITLDLSVCQ